MPTPPHPPPTTRAEPMTVEQAHRVMQEHLHCPTSGCEHRQAALTVLVDAGHYALAGP